jgi:hypothetical protein
MVPCDALGAASQGRCAATSGRHREEQRRTVIVFGQPPIPHPVQSERPCRDSDALIATPWIAIA